MKDSEGGRERASEINARRNGRGTSVKVQAVKERKGGPEGSRTKVHLC